MSSEATVDHARTIEAVRSEVGAFTRGARVALAVLAWLFVPGIAVQLFLAGLGVFVGASNFGLHQDFGYMLQITTLVIVLAAFAARAPRRTIGLAVALLLLVGLQSPLILLREEWPAITALHPVNAVAIFSVAVSLARRTAWRSIPIPFRGQRSGVETGPGGE